MAKAVKRETSKRRRGADQSSLPLGRKNLMVIGVGLLIIAAGYLALLEGSVEGFLPLVVAPILLVLGYCVVIPIGILYKQDSRGKDQK